MITIVIEPYKKNKERFGINSIYHNKGQVEDIGNAVMIIQSAYSVDGHRLDI